MIHCTLNIFLLLLSSYSLSIVHANDIIFYPKAACDQGNFNGCYNVLENQCCTGSLTGTFAISISKGPYDFALMFAGGGCTSQVCRAGTAGTFCCLGATGGLTGGRYITAARRFKRHINSSLPPPAENCTPVDPNVFGYAPGSGPGAGAWEIRADNEDHDKQGGGKYNSTYTFKQLHEEFLTIGSHDEKMKWLWDHGARYKDRLHDTPVIDIWAKQQPQEKPS